MISEADIKVKWRTKNPSRGNFVSVIMAYSETHIFKTAKQEWEKLEVIDINLDTHCICGRHISECRYITNRNNGNVLRIGQCCLKNIPDIQLCFSCHQRPISPGRPSQMNICSFCYENRQEIKPVEIPISVESPRAPENTPNTPPPLERTPDLSEFKKYLIVMSDPEGRKLINNFFNTLKMKKECQQCHAFNIPKDSPSYKKLCDNCFKTLKKEKLPCIRCRQLVISAIAPRWKRLCRRCNRQDKGISEEERLYALIDRISPATD